MRNACIGAGSTCGQSALPFFLGQGPLRGPPWPLPADGASAHANPVRNHRSSVKRECQAPEGNMTKPWRTVSPMASGYALTLDRRRVPSVSSSQGSKPVHARGAARPTATGPSRQACTRRTTVQGKTSARPPPAGNCNVGRRRPRHGRRSAAGSRRGQSLGPGTPASTAGHQWVNRGRATVATAARAHVPPFPAVFRPAVSHCSGGHESGHSSRERDAPLPPHHTRRAAPPAEMNRDEDRTWDPPATTGALPLASRRSLPPTHARMGGQPGMGPTRQRLPVEIFFSIRCSRP